MRTRSRRRIAGLAAVALALAVVAAGAPAAVATADVRPGGMLAPITGAYWGMSTYVPGGVAVREAQVGRTFNIRSLFYAWSHAFPTSAQVDDVAHHRIPMVTWTPDNVSLTDIANGVYDSVISARAQAVRAFGAPMFLRFAHEMNGNWYSWGGTSNGGATTGPAAYVAAWRHIHDIFVGQGATNVAWVWCVNQADVPGYTWNHWTNYYPGDSYVDWVGIDAYNWGNTNGGWRSMASILNSSAYRDYAVTKPIMLAETASAEIGGDKAAWIYDMGPTIQSDFPSVEAVVWFDQLGTSIEWPIDSSATALNAYRSVGQDKYFGGTGISDLVVTNISWTPAQPTNGDAVVLSATIKNQGSASTPDGSLTGVTFFVDGVAASWYGPGIDGVLAPGQSRTVTANGGPTSAFWRAFAGNHTVRALADDANRFQESSESNNDLTVPLAITSPQSGLFANYFNGKTLSGPPLSRIDAAIDFNWAHGSPAASISIDQFSARWNGFVTAPVSGAFTFSVKSDDGKRLWVNNQLLVNHWADGTSTDTATATVVMTAGQPVPIKMEYYENAYSALAQLLWQGPTITQQVVPASQFSH